MQQEIITRIVNKHFDAIKAADEPMAKLALVIAEENFQELCAIIPPSYDRSEIAILAGIDINTPPGVDDFFVPTEFKIRQKDGTFVSFLDNVISQVRVCLCLCVSVCVSVCLSVSLSVSGFPFCTFSPFLSPSLPRPPISRFLRCQSDAPR